MPLVKVDIYQGKSEEFKRAVLDGIHNALVTAFKIPIDDRNQRLYELADANFERSKKYSRDFTIIEILAFKGRTNEAKRHLFSEIVKNLSKNPGIKATDILITLNEQPLENWGVAGGKPANEVDLGFNVNV
jgi:phenylpyruvate tautomerase PptA (4-oxalocrotonate tautomerase family)